MVKIIAESLLNSPTASSCDRYKYRYGYRSNSSRQEEGEMNVYRRPVTKKKNTTTTEVDNTRNDVKNENGDEGCMNYCIHILSTKINILDNICGNIDALISKRPKLITRRKSDIQDEDHETREMHQNSMKKEKEKEKEEEEEENKEEDERERQKKEMIHNKLGRIVYHSRSGEIFVAEHSTETHIYNDKNYKQITTQKVVWNNRKFQTKQDWFSEMAKISAARAYENM